MLSVLLSVYRSENPSYLNQALVSIYEDQILKPDQVVLVLDGPLTPALNDVVIAWQNQLGDILDVVPIAKNVGLGCALNEGLKYCKGNLIARMDTDDISLPERLLVQTEFMNQNQDIVAASAVLEEWNESLNVKIGTRNLPTNYEDILAFSKRRSPLSHPLAIFRKAPVLEVGGYPVLRKAQDYALWSLLISKGYRLGNISQVLLKMRTGNEMLNRRGWSYFKQEFQLLKFQREIGFLSRFEFLTNVILKGGLRLAPDILKRCAYRFAR